MIKDTPENVKAHQQKLMMAFNHVFDKKSPFTQQVLTDLARFCRAHDSTFHPDTRIHAELEGRREVWLYIQKYLQLTEDEIYLLHRAKLLKGE